MTTDRIKQHKVNRARQELETFFPGFNIAIVPPLRLTQGIVSFYEGERYAFTWQCAFKLCTGAFEPPYSFIFVAEEANFVVWNDVREYMENPFSDKELSQRFYKIIYCYSQGSLFSFKDFRTNRSFPEVFRSFDSGQSGMLVQAAIQPCNSIGEIETIMSE